MRRLLVAAALAVSISCSYTRKIKNLSEQEFDHYYALRVYLNEDQRKEYLKLKTEEERNAWLKAFELPGLPPKSLWDTFYQYPDKVRQQIIDGDVQAGWTKDMLLMAWGAPMKSRKLPGRKAERSELLIYQFEKHADGTIMVWQPDSKTAYKAERMMKREVILDDDVIAEIRDPK